MSHVLRYCPRAANCARILTVSRGCPLRIRRRGISFGQVDSTKVPSPERRARREGEGERAGSRDDLSSAPDASSAGSLCIAGSKVSAVCELLWSWWKASFQRAHPINDARVDGPRCPAASPCRSLASVDGGNARAVILWDAAYAPAEVVPSEEASTGTRSTVPGGEGTRVHELRERD